MELGRVEEAAQSLPLASWKFQKATGGKQEWVLEELRSSWQDRTVERGGRGGCQVNEVSVRAIGNRIITCE